jgi:hypothetical protein
MNCDYSVRPLIFGLLALFVAGLLFGISIGRTMVARRARSERRGV